MPGPIVELMVMPLTYLPLAADGLAFSTELMTVMALSTSFCGSNESLPTGTWTSAVLSVRNSTLPALISRMAATTSVVTVPVLGLGIRPLGPSTLPRRPTDFIMSGVEGSPAFFLNLLDQLFAAVELGAGCLGVGNLVARGDDRDDLRLAEAMR